MSSSSSNAPQNAPRTNEPESSLEADIALLQKLLLSADSDASDPENENENIAELLKRLDAAEGLAGGVEERLDGIMSHLDALLGDLEAGQGAPGGGAEVEMEMEMEVEVEVRTLDVVAEVSQGRAEAEEELAGEKASSK